MTKRSPYFSLGRLISCSSIVIALVLCFAVPSSAQTALPTPTPLNLEQTNDFHDLFSYRETLIEDIKRLEQTIEQLADKARDLPPLKELQKELTRLEDELKKEQAATTRDDSKIAALHGYIDDTNEKLQTVKNATDLEKQKNETYSLRRKLTQVEQKIASVFDDKRDVSWFRAISTIVVGILIAVVVGGFYLIAWKKDGIAAKIFGGEMGMQFVTLFLIVIAIILFGIMGTLEGRELSALLGGLSGYILGKASAKVDASRNDSNPGGQDQQQQNEQQQQEQQEQQNQNPG